MALTLNSELQTAQDGANHRPVIEIVSESAVASIPFSGNPLNGASSAIHPDFIELSSGRLFGVVQNDSNDRVAFIFTDVNKTEFFNIEYVYGQNGYMSIADENDLSVVELSDGNVGIVYVRKSSSLRYLSYQIMTPEGVFVSEGDLATLDTATHTNLGLNVIKLANGTYVLMFARYTASSAYFEQWTSSDFIVWNNQGDFEISGLADSTHIVNHPNMQQITTGEVMLTFDYVESTNVAGTSLINVYYAISDDNCVSFGNATAITDFTLYGTNAYDPEVVQKIEDVVMVAYTEESSSLTLPASDLGTDNNSFADQIVFDTANRIVYVVALDPYVIESIAKINIDTWDVEKVWDYASFPAINQHFRGNDISISKPEVFQHKTHSEGKDVFIHTTQSICHLDGDADTIKNYCFYDDATNGLTQNVTWTGIKGGFLYVDLSYIHYDSSDGKLYTIHFNSYVYSSSLLVGYLDLTEGLDAEGNYAHHVLWELENPWGDLSDLDQELNMKQSMRYQGTVRIYPENDMILFSGEKITSYTPMTLLRRLSDGSLYKAYHPNSLKPEYYNAGFPYEGLDATIYVDDKIIGGIKYNDNAGEENRRGVVIIDCVTDIITYHTPAFMTVDDIGIVPGIISIGSNRILFGTSSFGVIMFNYTTKEFTQYDSVSVPGILSSINRAYGVGFNPIDDYIFCGSFYNSPSNNYFSTFPIEGVIKQIVFKNGVYDAGWTFDPDSPLVIGYGSDQISLNLNASDSSINAFWYSLAEDEVRWGMEASSKQLNDYIVMDGTPVTIKRSINGDSHTLQFNLSLGHLFDPSNINSILAVFVKKGRRLIVSIGENIDGDDVLVNQGAFSVTSVSIDYSFGDYPVASIEAKDFRVYFEDEVIIASDYYQSTPEVVIGDLLDTVGGIASANINLPAFDDGFSIEHQFVDVGLTEALNDLCNRFQYFLKLGVDDVMTAVKIDMDKSVDHVYTDLKSVRKYTPDDSYSDFTNKVIVKGQELNEIEILYAEERITSFNGTIGWWGCEKTHKIWYSEDQSKICRFPRLETIISATGIAFQLAGSVTEEITATDPEEKYCIVEIDAPNLIPMLLGCIAGYVAGSYIGDLVITEGFVVSAGFTKSVGRLIEQVFITLAFSILGSIANYQYDIHAQPAGFIRREIQGDSEDYLMQLEVGRVVTQTVDGFLCYTVSECTRVAVFELLLKQLQRRRVTFEKITHLQDQEGDLIQVKHPYTQIDTKVFITDIVRQFYKNNDDCSIIDSIEGWRV